MVIHQVARVEMWGQTVGALAYQPESGLCAFEYDSAWIRRGIEISPIRLPLSSRIYMFPALPRSTYHGLPGAFLRPRGPFSGRGHGLQGAALLLRRGPGGGRHPHFST